MTSALSTGRAVATLSHAEVGFILRFQETVDELEKAETTELNSQTKTSTREQADQARAAVLGATKTITEVKREGHDAGSRSRQFNVFPNW
jgi:hypothetical protein